MTAGGSSRGYFLADGEVALGAPLAVTRDAASGLLSLTPAAAAVNVTILLPLSPTYATTLLTPQVPWTQLLSNIVGLSGVLGAFGVLFGLFEAASERLCGGGATGAGGRKAQLVAAPAPPAAAAPGELLAVGQLPAAGSVNPMLLQEAPGGGAREAAGASSEAARDAGSGGEGWRRHCDSETGEVWFTCGARAEWKLPAGAMLEA
jgi:hypothetical protein